MSTKAMIATERAVEWAKAAAASERSVEWTAEVPELGGGHRHQTRQKHEKGDLHFGSEKKEEEEERNEMKYVLIFGVM